MSDSSKVSNTNSDVASLVVAAAAAFSTYFCMYAFRKPFTAGTYEGLATWGADFKSVIVISQLIGYMLAKFLGIKFVSEMKPTRRALVILILIGAAELTLAGFFFVPLAAKVPLMLVNGLCLGMVYGLVVSFLEGRRQTEALTAALCASFIMASGVVKSVGRWLINDFGVSDFAMPMLVGIIFAVPLLLSVWMLKRTPPPDQEDIAVRSSRNAMTSPQRKAFVAAYWPGLTLLIFVFVVLTVIRTARDDFAVEIWQALGVEKQPSVFALSETIVAAIVTAFAALTVWVKSNTRALNVTILLMVISFSSLIGATAAVSANQISALTFMVTSGVCLYFPYVAFHTTVFERLIAIGKRPGNLGFLMYLADAIGYLGYSGVLITRSQISQVDNILAPFFSLLWVGAIASIIALGAMLVYMRASHGQNALSLSPKNSRS